MGNATSDRKEGEPAEPELGVSDPSELTTKPDSSDTETNDESSEDLLDLSESSMSGEWIDIDRDAEDNAIDEDDDDVDVVNDSFIVRDGDTDEKMEDRLRLTEESKSDDKKVSVDSSIQLLVEPLQNAAKDSEVVHPTTDTDQKSMPAQGPTLPSEESFPISCFLTMKEVMNLKVGARVDHRDCVGRFQLAVIKSRKGDTVKIHYRGWKSKWDVTVNLLEVLSSVSACFYSPKQDCFAVPGSISERKAIRFTHLKVGDFIDVCPLSSLTESMKSESSLPVWYGAEIKKCDPGSGQVQVMYQDPRTKKIQQCWVHLDNPIETDEFLKHSGEVHQSEVETMARLQRSLSRKKSRKSRKKVFLK